MLLPNHGANPQYLYQQLGLEMPAKVYDFSENVNAFGPPAFVEQQWQSYLSLLQHYPNPEGEPFLTQVAAFHQLDKTEVLLGNGASELLTVLAKRYRHKRVILIHPTFSEYERTLRAAGAKVQSIVVEDVRDYTLPMEQLQQAMVEADALYLCIPNNPTGVLPNQQDIEQLLIHGANVACELVFDEAFMDWVEEAYSWIPQIQQYPHLIVVRSMTKMYAIPGIRLGYLVAQPAIIAALQQMLAHWNLNALALTIGANCLQETHYREQAITYAVAQRQALQHYLREHGCQVTNSVTNYVCFALPTVAHNDTFFQHCLTRGIVLRHTHNFLGLDGQWFRIGIKNQVAMTYLKSCLEAWFQGVEE
ncbi:pyridoxal phosphate-dependent aminotransferase [Lysinibacillus piscis]|uniref:Aminotransferase n=1 Tax=Lysinibacillus piscis TaxID=2518931 RepID=A0ABQ5NKR4_9BACI|nr:aminotransferase class I/II-fold pyridoxal phosphate-dependent enzyme [Lysinibacillus sp. KH24]GLC88865.1 threonine-phosphate decarboxylase [Lysinibacillus sp. KH24]